MPDGGGIIPARAGFTRAPRRPCGPQKDHPRSRGVYGGALLRDSGCAGSSPLARGLRWTRGRVGFMGGIIPARAGFTTRRGVWTSCHRGSSPLARGLRSAPASPALSLGIIPARAGFTGARGGGGPGHMDHPRSRGVYGPAPSTDPMRRWIIPARAGFTFDALLPGDIIYGSSPLARGLHLRILGIPTNPHSTRPLPPSLPT